MLVIFVHSNMYYMVMMACAISRYGFVHKKSHRMINMSAAPATSEPAQLDLLSTKIDNPGVALNALVSFLSQANLRGAFNLRESAKIFECIEFLSSMSENEPETAKTQDE